MALTTRDKEVIRAVNDCRVLRQDQIQRLFFPSRNTAQVRLQLLWQHGFLRREFLPVLGGVQTSPVLYTLDIGGAELLKAAFGYERTDLRLPSKRGLDPRFLQHTLGLAEIRVAFEMSCKRHGYTVHRWLDEPALKADYDHVDVRGRLLPILPDAYVVVRIGAGDLHFFVEFDTGTEDAGVLQRKLLAYWTYFLSGKCRARYGTNRIRVLTVTASDDVLGKRSRLATLRRMAGDIRDEGWFWFASLPKVSDHDMLMAAIWRTARDEEAQALLTD